MQEAFHDRPQIILRQADLSEAEQVNVVARWLKAKFGFIPYVINNAGVNIKGDIDALACGDVQRSLMVNALAPFTILRSLIPAMKANDWGPVINITSGAPLNCFPGFSAYSASKGALNALTVTCAGECADINVQINTSSGPTPDQG